MWHKNICDYQLLIVPLVFFFFPPFKVQFLGNQMEVAIFFFFLGGASFQLLYSESICMVGDLVQIASPLALKAFGALLCNKSVNWTLNN